MRFERVQGDLEPGSGRRGGLLCGRERVSPVGTVEMHLRTHVCRRQRAQELPLTGVGPVVIPVLAEADRGDAGAGRLADREPDGAFAARARGDVDGGDHEALTPLLAGLERCGPAQGDRRRVRLEVRIGPVAVVLRLPQIALELEQEPPARRELDLEPVVGGEERAVGAVHERLHADLVGEGPVELAVRGPGAKAGALRLAPRVMDADPDPVVRENFLGSPVEDDLDAAVLVAGDPPVPAEVDLPTCMAGVELDAEARVGLLHLEARDGSRHGVPVDVAHGGVDAAHELGVADAQVAEVDAVEQRGHGPGVQGAHLGDRGGGAVQEPEALGGRGHGCPPRASNRSSFSMKSGLSTTAGLARSAGTRPAAAERSAAQADSTQPRTSWSV